MKQFNGTDYDTLYPKTLGSQIASTVPVSVGGTGINVNPNIHVNLGAENTSNVFEAYPRPGVYGTLPVSHGGTGQTSLAALASAMGAAKIQTGSYVGTGTYGPSNPNSLTFSFDPIFFVVYETAKVRQITGSSDIRTAYSIFSVQAPVVYQPTRLTSVYDLNQKLCYYNQATKTFYWYWTSYYGEENQLNVSNITYKYWSIGV